MLPYLENGSLHTYLSKDFEIRRFQLGPKCHPKCFCRRETEGRKTDTQRRQAEMGTMWPGARNARSPEKPGEGRAEPSPWGARSPQLDFRLLAARTVPVVLSHPVCGHLL